MVRWSRPGFMVVLAGAVFLLGGAPVTALSSLDVLIVNDGHTLQDQSRLPDHRFVPTYREAVEALDNVNVVVYNTSADPDGSQPMGPSADVMDDYDVVIWYTLQDYGGNPNCPASGQLNGQEECRTFFGDGTDPANGGGDYENITTYLQDRRGRMFLTGHKINYENRQYYDSFYRDVLQSWAGNPRYYECNTRFGSCSSVSKSEISTTLQGEANDPVSKDSFFTFSINTTLEPKSERGIFTGFCRDEYPLTGEMENFCSKLITDDVLRWKHSSSSDLYGHDYNDDWRDWGGAMEEWANSMTRVNSSDQTAFGSYKLVYAGFGFESIIGATNRRQLMNWTIHYLAGPRVDQTAVRDSDDLPETSVDEGKYANNTVNVTATCVNGQIQTGTDISAAQFFNSGDGIPAEPRGTEGDSRATAMTPVTGSFGDESREDVEYLNWDIRTDLVPTGAEGTNYTIAVQCRDTTNAQYWGQYEEDWIVVDDVAPQVPLFVNFSGAYTNNAATKITVNYKQGVQEISKGGRADLVRFSCDQSSWSGWQVYDDTVLRDTFTVNITDDGLGCSDTDRNVTLYVQARDFAGNGAGSTESDFIVLDRVDPALVTPIDPVNGSIIRETRNITVNATDDRAGVTVGASQVFNNETVNQSFTGNQSFDPDWTSSGSKTLLTYVFDRAGNVLRSFFRFTVDLQPPTVDKVSPGNDSVIRSTDTVTVDVSDATANISRFAAYNGTHWDNQTVDKQSTSRVIDPGWTTEGEQVLTIWLNDTVDRITRTEYRFAVDDSPPDVLTVSPTNTSFLRSSDNLVVDIVDRFAAGIDLNLFQRDGSTNTSFVENQSIDPGWTNEGLHNATVFSNDTLSHYNSTFFQFTVDDTAPSVDTITPAGSFLNESGTVTITVSDGRAGISVGRWYNGTHNRSFQDGAGFDPGWTSDGLHTLDIWVNDTAGNMQIDGKSWQLDTTPPAFQSITPSNTSFITSTDSITINVDEDGSGLSVGRFFNGTGNQSFTDGAAFNPGWTTSTTHTLQVWVNDTVQHMAHTGYTFHVDDLPPTLSSASPANTSHITSTENLTLTLQDRGGGGGVGRDVVIAFNGTHNQSIVSGQGFDPVWGEGVHDLYIWKNDTLGNMNRTRLRYTVDDTPPTTTDNHVFSGWRTSNKTIDLDTADNFGAALISSCIYDKAAAVCTPTVTGAPNVTVTVGCVAGDTCVKLLRYRANDTAGNTETLKETANVSIDKAAPAVTFVTPTDGQTVAGTIDLAAVVADEGSGVNAVSVQYSLVNKTGGSLGAVIETDALNRSNFDTSTVISTAGAMVFNISAVDAVGNTVNSTNITFNIDNRAVVTSIVQPSRQFLNGDILIDLRASRLGGGVQNMTYNITNSSGSVLNETTRDPAGGIDRPEDDFSFTVPVTGSWTDGNHTLLFTSFDNETTAPTVSTSNTEFVLDRTRPATAFTTPNSSWVSGSATIGYDVTDAWPDKCQYQYRNSSAEQWSSNISVTCGATNSFQFDTTSCQDDASPSCMIRLFGRDKAGNINSTTVRLRVDNSPPTAAITTAAGWKNTDFTVSHTENDPQGLVNRSYRINGSAWQPMTGAAIGVDISAYCPVAGAQTCPVTINVTNKAGTTVTKTRTYSIDTTPPQLDAITPDNTSNITSAETVRIDFDAAVAGADTSTANNGTHNLSFSDAAGFNPGWTVEGRQTLDIWVVDRAGNVLRRHMEYTLDDTAPIFVSAAPTNGSAITPTDTITVDVQDAVTGIADSVFDNGEGLNRTFSDNTSFDPVWTTDGYHWIDFYLEDFADNNNHTTHRYLVDGTPPTVLLAAPANGSAITADQNITVNAADAGAGIHLARFTNIETGGTRFFTPNQSFNPGWTGQGSHLIEPRINDTVNNTGAKRFYFTVDATPPNISSVGVNTSVVRTDGAVEIRAVAAENYSSIALVKAQIIKDGAITDRLTLTRVGATDTFNTSFAPGTAGTQAFVVNVTVNDTLGHNQFKTTTFLVDATPPNATGSRFNVSQDQAFGSVRIYRDEAIRFRTNLTDNGAIGLPRVVLNTSSNPASGSNRSLSRTQGTVKQGVWETSITDTGAVGTYNLVRLYVNDSVGNRNTTDTLPAFLVVNHSIQPQTGGVATGRAGNTTTLNVTVNLNRTLTAPTIRIPIPPSTLNGLQTPAFQNTTSYQCGFTGATCNIAVDRVAGEVAAVNVSTTGAGSLIWITAPVTLTTPAADVTHTWFSSVAGHEQQATTTITAPFINISAVFCGADTDCNVSQRQAFTLNVTVNNTGNASHSGAVSNGVVNASGNGIFAQTALGALPSGQARNASIQLNISTAGTVTAAVTAADGLSGRYQDQVTALLDVADTVPPNATDQVLDSNLVNVNHAAVYELTGKDNKGVDTVTVTVVNASDMAENHSMSLVSGNTRLGLWRLSYTDTGTEGTYNLTRLYINDSAGNWDVTALNDQFDVVRLRVLPTVNVSTQGVGKAVQVAANVTGNTTAVDRIVANITKPRNLVENLTLETGPAVEAFEGRYTNTSRSGIYQVNITAATGLTAWNTTTFSVPFGATSVTPLDGNTTHLMLPQGETPYTVSWQVTPQNGDLEDVNTTLTINNPAIIDFDTGQTNFSFLGNVTYEQGFGAATFNLTDISQGATTMTFAANTSRGSTANRTVTVEVVSTDATAPNITGFEDTPGVVNKQQAVTITANISEQSILENATIIVSHPETGSGAVEQPVLMTRTGNGQYRYRFTNTNETGHYTYEIRTWDIAGNTDSIVSNSFNVTAAYNVTVAADHSIYRKGEEATFTVTVQDTNRNPVTGFNTTVILGKAGTNQTLLSGNRTDEASYSFKTNDAPTSSESASNVPAAYTVYVNVSSNGNTGQESHRFNVSRLFLRDETNLFTGLSQGDDVTPGAPFNVTVNLDYPRGDPVSEAVVFVRCNTCPSDFRFLDPQGDGSYSQTFTAPSDADSALLRVFARDGLGNSESQDDQAEPAISVDVTTGGSGPGGQQQQETSSGGGGGGAAGPALDITDLAPVSTLPANTSTVTLSAVTSLDATCQYRSDKLSDGEDTVFEQTGGTQHSSQVAVAADTGYDVRVSCQTDAGLEAERPFSFFVRPRAVETFDVQLPGDAVAIDQGTNTSVQISLFNNGTSRINLGLRTESDCCTAWFTDLTGSRIPELTLASGTGQVIELVVDVPLHTRTGRHSVIAEFVREGEPRPGTVTIQVEESPARQRYAELQQQAAQLEQRITSYRETGIETAQLETDYRDLQQVLEFAETAIEDDRRDAFQNSVAQAEQQASTIQNQLDVLAFQQYIRTNWWKWVAGFGVGYAIFFLLTMVALPYYRLRTQYLNLEQRLDNAIDARRKAEQQYFRREIDRSTFMQIMTERQDEILEMRGEREDVETALEHAIRSQLTPQNFVKAPVKAVREVVEWWKAKKAQTEE